MEAILVLLNSFVIYLSNKASTLQGLTLDATVEAEFGDHCVDGKLATLAHHGPRSYNPPPCSNENVPTLPEGSSVGLSHMDLDTIGGLLRLAGYVPTGVVERAFWMLAGLLDLRGFHCLSQCVRDVDDQLRSKNDPTAKMDIVVHMINAYHAWAEKNRVFPPRDGSAMSVTEQVVKATTALQKIFASDEALMNDGIAFAAREAELNNSSYMYTETSANGCAVVVRHSKEGFTNHLYTDPSGEVCQVVIALRDDFGSITVSRAADDVPLNCQDIVQALWGSEAGGHDGIAGSPRGDKMTLKDIRKATQAVIGHFDSQVR